MWKSNQIVGREMLSSSNRQIEADKKFDCDERNSKFENHLFLRLVAKSKLFEKVKFRYTIFDSCYLRDCRFDSCDFTGCRFVSTNLHGSKFSGCTFDYAIFERTNIDPSILDDGCPGMENLKQKFARTLRTNYQQLGDAPAVNKAMAVELQAAEIHLWKACWSNEAYYRKKYRSWLRIKTIFEWLSFKLLKYIWGNGESAIRLLISAVFLTAVIAGIDIIQFGDPTTLGGYVASMERAVEIFLGVLSPPEYSRFALALVTLARLIFVGFLLSIIIKKFNRR